MTDEITLNDYSSDKDITQAQAEKRLQEIVKKAEALGKQVPPVKLPKEDVDEAKALKIVISRLEQAKYYEGEFQPDFTQLFLDESFLGGISIGV